MTRSQPLVCDGCGNKMIHPEFVMHVVSVFFASIYCGPYCLMADLEKAHDEAEAAYYAEREDY